MSRLIDNKLCSGAFGSAKVRRVGNRLVSSMVWLGTLASMLASDVHAEVIVKTDFEGASARILEIDQSKRKITFMPGGDPQRGWVCWWALRVEGIAAGERIVFELHPSDQPTRNNGQLSDKPLAASWCMPRQAAWSEDGRSWHQTEPGKQDKDRMVYEVTSPSSTLWLAWGPLFTPLHGQAVIAQATAKLPGSRPFELATSREKRAVMGWSVGGDPDASDKPGVWIQARQHAWESGSSWVAQGFVEWLCERNEAAQRLIEHANIVVIPIVDVDNVATGNGGKEADPRDHNRDWDASPVYPAVAAAQKKLKAWADHGRLDFFIDLHNPAPNDKQPFFFCGPTELLSDLGRDNQSLFLGIAHRQINGPLPVRETPRYTGPSYHPLWREISGQWVTANGNSHTVAICLETSWNTEHSTTDGYRRVGNQLGETIAEYLQRRRLND